MTRFFEPRRKISFVRYSARHDSEETFLGDEHFEVKLVAYSCDTRCVVSWLGKEYRFSTVEMCMQHSGLTEELLERVGDFDASSATRFVQEALRELERLDITPLPFLHLIWALLNVWEMPVNATIKAYLDYEISKQGGTPMKLGFFRTSRPDLKQPPLPTPKVERSVYRPAVVDDPDPLVVFPDGTIGRRSGMGEGHYRD